MYRGPHRGPREFRDGATEPHGASQADAKEISDQTIERHRNLESLDEKAYEENVFLSTAGN